MVDDTRMCVFSYARITLYFCDLHLHPMTLIYELYLYVIQLYLLTKMKFLRQGFQRLEH